MTIRKGTNRARRTSERGASLVIALLAATVMSTTAFATMSYLKFLYTERSQIQFDFSNTLLQSNLVKLIKSPTAWSFTVADMNNHFIACEQDPTTCLAITSEAPLILRDAENNVVINGLTGTSYNFYGESCPTTTCPLLVKATWKGICDDTNTCTQISINLEFQQKEQNGSVSKSKLSILKNYFIGSASKSLSVTVNSIQDLKNPTAKIIFILDSSESMADNFAKVKKGLTGMMSQLSGKDVEIYFYTTASLEILANLKEHWKSLSLNSKEFKKVAAFEAQNIDDVNFQANLTRDMSRKINQPLEPSMDTNTILSRLDAILATYVSVYGSDRESGLCTLHRIITDEGPNRIIYPNDLAFFVIVTDENDEMMDPTSVKYLCNKSEKMGSSTTDYITNVACDPSTEVCKYAQLYFLFKGTSAYIKYQTKTNDSYSLKIKTLCQIDERFSTASYRPCPFTSSGTFPCSPKELNEINPTGSLNIYSCEVLVDTNSNMGALMAYDYTAANFVVAATNACTGGSFPYKDQTYVNIQDYVSRNLPYYQKEARIESCKYSTHKTESGSYSYEIVAEYKRMSGQSAATSDIDSAGLTGLRQDIANTLKEKFGAGGYSIRAFIHDPVKDQGLCALTDGSYGTAYKDFIQFLGNTQSGYDSICKDDYQVSFDTLTRTIENKINNSFVFDITSEDRISSIIINRSGSSITLDPSLYEVVGQKVIFQDGTLQNGDEINLVLAEKTTTSW